MKSLFTLIVVALIAVGGWYVWQNQTIPGTTETNDTTDSMTENGSTNEADNTDDTDTSNASTEDEEGATVSGNVDISGSVDTDGEQVTIDMTGSNYEYDVEEIRVQEGDTVTVNFTSSEGFHDFVVDAFDAQTERVNVGEQTSVTFVADTAGTYEYYCSVGNHRAQGMVGTLIVE